MDQIPIYQFHRPDPSVPIEDSIGALVELKNQGQFIAALDALPWKPPTVFLMRRGANDTYTLRLASDVYPNQPNVKRYQVAFEAALLSDPRFSVTVIGPFVLAIRLAH